MGEIAGLLGCEIEDVGGMYAGGRRSALNHIAR